MDYNYGEKLSLSGLAVTLTYSDNTTKDVAYANFGANRLTTSINNNKVLNLSDNGPITITYSDGISQTQSVTTDDYITVSNIKISDINAIITGPVTGSKPSTTATATGFTGTVTWSPYDDTFKPLAEYTATVTLEIKEGYELVSGGFTSVRINGKDANLISTSGGFVTLSYDFPKTAASPNAIVTQITITKQPIRLKYTNGEKLDLSGMIVELEYSDGLTDQATVADFAAKRITTNPINNTTLSSILHNNARIEVKYTYNNKNMLVYTDSSLVVQKKIIPNIVISGKKLGLDSEDSKKFTYVAECGVDEVTIDVTQEDTEILIDTEKTNVIEKELEYGDNTVRITATPIQPNTGSREEYILNVKKPYPAEQMVKILWNNTIAVADNSKLPFEFVNYSWYRNDKEIGSGWYWSAGSNGERLDPEDNYYVEAKTKDGNNIRSCDVKIQTTTSPSYGILLKNSVASSHVGFEIFAPEATRETEITVYDITGKQLFKQMGNYDLNVSNVSNGMYILTAKVKGESGKFYRYSAKFVVKK